MPDINGIPYVESSDLVSAYPAVSQSLAQAVSDQLAEKLPYSYGTATPTTTDSGFLWYDSNSTPAAPKFWNGSSFVDFPSGLSLVASETFSAVSSVSINGCFTSAYESYRIVIAAIGSTDGSTGVPTRARLRASGTDNSVNYRGSHIFNTQSAGPSRVYAISLTSMLWGWIFDGNGGQVIVDLSKPATTEKTSGLTASQGFGSAGAITGFGGVSHDTAAAYDGFTFFPESGTLTGSVRVYGYKD